MARLRRTRRAAPLVRLAALAVLLAAAAAPVTGPRRAAARRIADPVEAVRRAFPAADTVRRRTLRIDPAEAAAVSRDAGGVPVDTATVFLEALAGDSVVGRGVVMDVLGQYQPITVLVAIAPDGRVGRVEILAYRETRGGTVRRRAFLDQFAGRSPRDPVRLGRDVTAVTGATISSRSVARAVRAALRLHERLRRAGPAAPAEAVP